MGRGIDQIMPHPSNPVIHEGYMRSAQGYIRIAEEKLGHSLPRQVPAEYVWGDALRELQKRPNALRIVNLETSVTVSESHWPGKGIHYRMHPANVGVLSAAGVNCCVLANNHVLDWGYAGLQETLYVLKDAGIHTTGAGETIGSAAKPAILNSSSGHVVVVLSISMPSAGVPSQWAASSQRPGVNFCAAPNAEGVEMVKAQLAEYLGREGVIVVVSIHWGANWGYQVTAEERSFAHSLIDAGVDIVHGHSSHHIKALEMYQGRLILYGCGDFLNDYEGIGHRSDEEQFRSDICLMYLPSLNADGRLERLELIPMENKEFSVRQPSPDAVDWVRQMLNRECKLLGGAQFKKSADNTSLELILSRR